MDNYLPPHDVAAEQQVLGAMLLSPTAIDEAGRLLRGRDFYKVGHELVYDAMVDLAGERQPVDAVTVGEELRRRGYLDKVGGLPYLADLVHTVSVTANVVWHAQIVREKAVLRRLLDASLNIRQQALEATRDATSILTHSQALLDEIQPPTERQAGKAVADLWPGVIDLVDKGGVHGPALPWPDLDRFLNGLQPGKLYVVGARPGVGKSMFGQSLMAHWVDKHETDVYVASFEMPAQEISMRLLSAKAAVQYNDMVTGHMSEASWDRVARASSWAGARRIVINDDSTSTMVEIRAGARDLARKGNLGLIVIDYAGIVNPRDPSMTQQQHVSEVSRLAKQLAMELGVPVVLLSQLNREVASRGKDAAPTLTDLRDSGGLEQDADVVLLLHLPRDDRTEAPSDWDLHVIVAKNRSGQMGTVRLVRQGFIMRIVMRDKASQYRHEGV